MCRVRDFFTTVCGAAAGTLEGRYPQQDRSAFVNAWRAAYFDHLKSLTPTTESRLTVDSVVSGHVIPQV
jgi:2-haloacid dehalogenase